MQGLAIHQDFYVFDLERVDITLEMDWLAQLGKIRENFGELTLQIPTKECFHVLQRDPTLAKAVISSKTLV